jgi:phosphoenolpyruvate carboxykinase (ATP)
VASRVPSFDLFRQGIDTPAKTHWNLGTAPLVETAVSRGEGVLAKHGPLVVATGQHTGRSANDKFIVRDAETENTIWWDNNKSMSPDHFAALKAISSRRAGRRRPCSSRSVRRLAARASRPCSRDQRARLAQPAIRTLLVRPGEEERRLRA